MIAPPSAPIQLGTRKKLTYTLVVFVGFFLSVELAARVGSFLVYGRNPYYLLYGLRSWSNEEGEGHTDKRSGYFKFPPDQRLEFGTPEPSRINNQGFRGEDFDVQKPAGVFRIACLGASSTFGYLNRDHETYPHRLSERLAELDPGRSGPAIEVINAGIPHFNTENIVAALEGEILGWDPDLMTLYTGCNDAVRPLAESRIQATCRAFDEYSAAYAGMRKALNGVFGEVLFGQWTPYLARMERAAIERQLALHEARTRENVARIIALAEGQGIPLVLIRQPITTWFDREARGLVPAGEGRETYEDEYARLSAELEAQGWLRGFEVTLYVHHRLLDVLDELAAAHGLTTVDNVALVAAEPDGLGSKVHLTAPANARLAEVLAETLAPLLPWNRP